MIFLREKLAPVWKEARLLCLQGTLIFRLSLQHPWLSTPKRHLFLTRTEAPGPQIAAIPAGLALSPHLVVELPPAPETQL